MEGLYCVQNMFLILHGGEIPSRFQGLSPAETLDMFGVTHDLLISKGYFLSVI